MNNPSDQSYDFALDKLTPKQRGELLPLLRGPQRHTLLVGGARSGKTFTLTIATIARAVSAAGSRHLIARNHHKSVRTSIWEDTLPKARAIFCPWLKWKSYEQDSMLVLPNGAEIWLSGLDEKQRVEKILGTEYATIFLNEVSEIARDTVLTVRTRLAQRVNDQFGAVLPLRMYYDLNPTGTGHWSYREFFSKVDPDTGRPLNDPAQFAAAFVQPADNMQNLPDGYMSELDALPERQRRRFRDGIYQPAVEGALWTIETIERSRCTPAEVPHLKRIVVAVDPSGASGDHSRSDEIGIVAAGLADDGSVYVLADHTVRGVPPDVWGRKAISAYQAHRADRIIAEVNYGGDMVRHVITVAAKAQGLTVPIKKITATRGKVVRAEPVSVLYESNRVKHVGSFEHLEEQMLNMSAAGYQGSRSPDRLDALVWAITDLAVKQRIEPPPYVHREYAIYQM